MFRVYLLGYPLAASWSPVMQQAAFLQCGLAIKYESLSVPENLFPHVVRDLRGKYVLGANVTTPYKEVVIPLLDATDWEAERVGVVNTVINRDGKLIGYNTDVEGALATLMGLGSGEQRIALLGAGCAARSVLAALSRPGVRPRHVAIVNRSEKRLQALAALARCQPYAVSLSAADDFEVSKLVKTADLVINATTSGDMWRQWEILSPVWDLNYGSTAAPLKEFCRQQSLPHTDGTEMLVTQAMFSFRLWTDREVNRDVFAAALAGARLRDGETRV